MTFSHFILYFLLAVGILLSFRLVMWMSAFSCRIVMVLTRMGLHSAAKIVLLLVAYDQATYLKSRFTYWNQLHVRFRLFWGIQALLLALLLLLWAGNKIQTIVPYWVGCLMLYIIYRCLVTLGSYGNASDVEEMQDSSQNTYLPGSPTYVRQWDYLDELFNVG